MNEWNQYKLEELGTFFGGVTTIKREDYGFGTPFITYKNVFKNSKIDTSILELMNIKKNDVLKRNCVYGDIFFTASSETPDEVAMSSVLLEDVPNLTFNGFCKRFRLHSFDKLKPEYARYLFRGKDFRNSAYEYANGDVRFNISQESLSKITIRIPDILTQTSIVEILTSLDDKIELNNKINQELESLAQLLFKRWFVDFEFPNENGEPYKSSGGEMVASELGEIPKGWRLGKFGELVDVINGYAFKSKDFDNSQEEGIVKIKNINGLTVDIKNTDFVSSNVVSNLNRKFKINSGDILIAMTGAEVGKIGVVPETKQNLWLNQRVGKVVPKDVKNTSFIHTLYNFLNLIDVVKNEAMGSAQPNISSTGIESIKILIPAQIVIEEFSRIFNDKYFLFVSSLAEIQNLSELRDTLLPKLISGELQINEN